MPRRARRLRRTRHVVAARVGAGIVVLLVTITLVTSFTASTNVPTSRVGTSTQARLIMQLAPAGCSSLALTVLVQGTGTFSNSQSHALVLGSAGSNTITDTGTGNCIVAGGGTDSTTGTATDICITGPTLNIANPCPVAAPTLTFAVSGTQPTTATAGTAFNVTVHALSNGALDTTYTGAHTLTWGGANASPSGAVATLPSPTWASGSVTIPITLVAADTETLTMTDGTDAQPYVCTDRDRIRHRHSTGLHQYQPGPRDTPLLLHLPHHGFWSRDHGHVHRRPSPTPKATSSQASAQATQ